MDNFICDCGKTRFISKYTTSIKTGGGFIYKEGNKEITCNCGSVMKSIEREFKGVPNIGKFSSASREQKTEMLKQRSREHFKKNISDQRQEMSTNDKIY